MKQHRHLLAYRIHPTGYSKPVFKVTESEIFLLRADGSVWDEYDMPEDDDVVSYIEALLSSIGL